MSGISGYRDDYAVRSPQLMTRTRYKIHTIYMQFHKVSAIAPKTTTKTDYVHQNKNGKFSLQNLAARS